MDKLDKLKNILEILKTDTISASTIKEFLELVLGVVKKSKAEFEEISKENLQKIDDFISFIELEHSGILSKVTHETNQAKKEFDEYLKDARKFLEEVKAIKVIVPKDGKDGRDGRDGESINGKDGKDGKDGSPDTGVEIVNKINELPTTPENQIDASHIKNLPESTGGKRGGISYASANTRYVKYHEGGSNLYVTATEPENPELGDLWLDLS